MAARLAAQKRVTDADAARLVAEKHTYSRRCAFVDPSAIQRKPPTVVPQQPVPRSIELERRLLTTHVIVSCGHKGGCSGPKCTNRIMALVCKHGIVELYMVMLYGSRPWKHDSVSCDPSFGSWQSLY